eukprot:TRINITY_DN4912_c0_g1_i1.p1 TRINITY_DN4912_c0_g1~~TRINITY_DN4912_c0_g1_i1.p1  ORF type:complete len:369 (+),score=64.24 TRINITY_DN4912_c0_g1_i1:384-1490(+)
MMADEQVMNTTEPRDLRARNCSLSVLFSQSFRVSDCIFGRLKRTSADGSSQQRSSEGVSDMLPLVLFKEDHSDLESDLAIVSPISQLPDDILNFIFQFLPVVTLCQAAAVCTLWRKTTKANNIWQKKCLDRWTERFFTKYIDIPINELEEGTWKTLFRDHFLKKKRFEEMKKSLSNQTKIRQNECDVQFKVVLLGATGVGKSNLLARLTRDEFDSASAPTVGIEFSTKMSEIGKKLVKCQLWDIGTSESTNRSTKLLSSTYCRGAVGALIVFDITQRASFEKIGEYMKLWKDCNSRPFGPSCILVGNKCDLYKSRSVSAIEAEEFAENNRLDAYIEVSARSNTNVEDALYDLLTACHTKYLQTQKYEQ